MILYQYLHLIKWQVFKDINGNSKDMGNREFWDYINAMAEDGYRVVSVNWGEYKGSCPDSIVLERIHPELEGAD